VELVIRLNSRATEKSGNQTQSILQDRRDEPPPGSRAGDSCSRVQTSEQAIKSSLAKRTTGLKLNCLTKISAKLLFVRFFTVVSRSHSLRDRFSAQLQKAEIANKRSWNEDDFRHHKMLKVLMVFNKAILVYDFLFKNCRS